jgi:NAD(P)-dependent dehydrogenase (short-subunit alcohol dehydrogenase family)
VPDDIAGPVLFLLGPGSGYMTGQTLWVNGGAYMP